MDTGYSWLILAGAFLNYFITVGNLKSQGLLYAELLDYYGKDSASTTFYLIILRVLAAFIGPLAGFISVTYSFRGVSFVGGVFVGVGFTASAFVRQPEILFFTYSTLIGIGFGLVFTPSIGIVNYHFKKRRALATGIVTSAGGLSVVFNLLFRFAFDSYGLHGGLLLIGGVFLNICVGSTVYRQPHILRRLYDNQFDKSSSSSVLRDTTQFLQHLLNTYKTILKCRGFILYSIAFALALLGYTAFFIIMPPHLQSRGVTKPVIVLILITAGGTETVSRIVFGRIVDQKYIKPDILFIINIGISGVMSLIFPFFDSLPLYFVYTVALGLFPGSMFAYLTEIIIPVCGIKLLSPAISLYFLVMNIFILSGVPFVGLLEDVTGNWKTSFRVLGGVHIISSLVVLIGRICYREVQETMNKADGIQYGFEKVSMTEKVTCAEEPL